MKKLLSLLVILLSGHLFAQTTQYDIKKLNEIYGADDILVNGVDYSPLHPAASGHPFLGNNIFTENYIVLKGRTFENVSLKYDIEKQVVLLNFQSPGKANRIIELNNNYILEFGINQKRFVKIDESISTTNLPFIQLIYSGKLAFGKTYSKEFVGSYSNKYPGGKYSKLFIKNILIKGDELIEIKRKKDLFSVFPEHKHQIKIYIKTNHIKFRKATNNQWHDLIKFCDGL